MRYIVGLLWMLALLGTGRCHAAEQCVLPPELPAVYDVKPDDEVNACLRQSVATPTEYFMLVFSWSPGFCESQKSKTDGGYPKHLQLQCVDNQFGWVVHGLWAELRHPQTCDGGAGATPTALHPRYCKGNLPQLPAGLVRANLCMMPGTNLVQGEWEKHGACDFSSPEDYFVKIRTLRDQLTLPETGLQPPELFAWMREHNPQLAGRRLDFKSHELQVCYSTSWQPIDC